MNDQTEGRLRQTELDELPDEWEMKQLREALNLCHGGIWGDAPDESEDVFPVIRSTEIDHEGRLHLDSPSLAYRRIPRSRATRYILENGDLLIVKSSGSKHLIGRVGLFWAEEGRPFLFSNFMQRLRANPEICHARFLYYMLSSQIAERELRRLQETTSGLRNLPIGEDPDMTIPLPPLPEQRRIVGVLRLVDELIDRTRQLVEQYRRLKKMALRRLLTKGIDHTRFGQTELGELPEEWEVKELRQVLSLCHGGIWGDDADDSEDVFPVIRSTEIDHDGKLHLDSPSLAYRKVPRARAARYIIENGDLLIVKSSGSKHLIGRAAFFSETDEHKVSLFSNFMQRLRAKPEICDARFLFYVLSSDIAQHELQRLQETTSGLRNLPMDEYLAMAIPLPPLREQREIAQHLQKLDSLIENEQRYAEAVGRLKRVWLDQLLTGKVRVPPEAEQILMEALPDAGG